MIGDTSEDARAIYTLPFTPISDEFYAYPLCKTHLIWVLLTI